MLIVVNSESRQWGGFPIFIPLILNLLFNEKLRIVSSTYYQKSTSAVSNLLEFFVARYQLQTLKNRSRLPPCNIL